MPSSKTSYTRRRWLGTMGLTAASAGVFAKLQQSQRLPTREELRVLAQQTNAKIAEYFPEETSFENLAQSVEETFKTPSQRPKYQRLEQTPSRKPAPPRPPSDYEKFLVDFDFRYISPSEIIQPHRRTRNGVSNSLPPSHLWANMPETLRVADEIRHRLGTPLDYITSAYRSPSYNRQCGGASQSYHMQNNALDLVYASGPDAAYAIAKQLRKEGFFRGGIGLYRGFIHVDTRGYNSSWVG